MSTLKEKAEQILQEKEEKIIPENFGENLEIFDVTGDIKDLSDAREVFTKITLGAENLDMTSQSGNMLIKNIELDYNINDKVILSKSSPIAHIVTKEAIAEAIDLTADKLKKGETILGIEGTVEEGIDTSDATATEDDILFGKTAYIDGAEVTGKIPTYDYGLDSGAVEVNNITDDSSMGVLNAIVNINSCAYENGVFVEPETDMPTSIAYSQLVPEIGLTADKIVAGETILGVEGTAEGIDTSDATATENDIVAGKTAYVNGEKLSGNIYVPNASSGYTYADSVVVREASNDRVEFLGTAGIYDDVLIKRGLDIHLFASREDVLEIVGEDTADATAVADDLAMGKTAYAKGRKLIGTIPVYSEYAYKLMTPSVKELGPNNTVTILGTMDIDKSVLLKPNASVELAVPQSSIASTAGLVANKIKYGETILGVTGTFQGDGVNKIHINYSTSVITVHCGVIVDMLMSAIDEGVITLNDELDIASSGLSPVCLRLCDVEPSGDSSIIPGYIGLAINLDDVATYLVYIDGNQSEHLLGAVDEYGSASEYSLTMTVNNLIRILSNLGDIEIRFNQEELEEADVYNEFVTTFYEFLNASGSTVNRGKLQANSDTMTISEV